MSEYKAISVRASVQPHDHRGTGGPHDIQIGVRAQSSLMRRWKKGTPVLLDIFQMNEDNNFTLLRVLFLKPGAKKPRHLKGPYKRAFQRRRKRGDLRVSIKARYSQKLDHPLPVGGYGGTVTYDEEGTFALLSLQAVTLRKKEPEASRPKIIITPGDPCFHESLRRAEKTLS